MARYDQDPGFSAPQPTGESLNPGALSNAQGSGGAMARPDGGQAGGTPVHVSFSFDSSQGGGYTVDQAPGSTAAANSPMVEKISGSDQTQNPGSGTVITPVHPGAGK